VPKNVMMLFIPAVEALKKYGKMTGNGCCRESASGGSKPQRTKKATTAILVAQWRPMILKSFARGIIIIHLAGIFLRRD